MAAVTDAAGNLPDLTFTRVYDAPRALVFKVWTDPYHVAQWWGPHGLTIPLSKVDACAGGQFEVHMQADDGSIYPSVGTFHEVVPPERIVFSSDLIDADGNKLLEVVNTVTVEEEDGKTLMTLHVKVSRATPEAAVNLAGMEAGWTESLERLASEIARQGRIG
jgi:uncharacterized protein YndB with AHSA1/START domain